MEKCPWWYYLKSEWGWKDVQAFFIRLAWHFHWLRVCRGRGQKSLNKKSPRKSERNCIRQRILHFPYYFIKFFHSVDWWGCFVGDVGALKHRKLPDSASIDRAKHRPTWALASYVQWKANVETLAFAHKVKNWAFLGAFSTRASVWGWMGKLEDYVLGLQQLLLRCLFVTSSKTPSLTRSCLLCALDASLDAMVQCCCLCFGFCFFCGLLG